MDGMGEIYGALVAKCEAIAQSMLGAIKNFFGIHSPSRVMNKEVGLQLMAGEAKGIADNTDLVTRAVKIVGNETLKSFDTQLAYTAAANIDTAHRDTTTGITRGEIREMLNALQHMQIVLDTGEVVGGTVVK